MAGGKLKSLFERWGISPIGITALALVFFGFFLGITIHMAFFLLIAPGAFGPGLLRQLGVIEDLDECQKQASIQAAHRAYLAGGIFLTCVTVARSWTRLSLGEDFVPASLVLILMLVVYGVSYCLSFWDPRQAAFLVLFGFGLIWLTFVVLSHGNEPIALMVEGALVAVPFFIAAFLAKRWPRVIGVLLVAASIAAVFFFHLVPPAGAEADKVFGKIFVILMLPLPLALMGLALFGKALKQE
ncbi:MAG: hypothetical protein EHM61_09055 [Acidobacteria bacterium]|nr:MAG: hypothetical protein EHM61_09055 [Acidobacteriota bacterium]